MLVFLYDLTLPSKTVDDGICLLEKMFDRLRGAALKLNASKCKLLQTKVRVLGLIVNKGEISMNLCRLEIISSLQFPKIVKEPRFFCGLASIPMNCLKKWVKIV